jgi:uncharacterized membrane protein YdfJ with MMPL/SSD domain
MDDSTSAESEAREPLLSSGVKSTPLAATLPNRCATPTSMLVGALENSPSRSFVETSFYTHVRGLNYSLPGEEEDEDSGEEEEEEEEEEDLNLHPVVRRWNREISRCRNGLLICIILLLWPFGFLSFVNFHKNTGSTFKPIPGTPSAAAQEAFESAYSDNDWQDPLYPPLVIVLESNGNSLTKSFSPAFPQAQAFALNVSTELNNICWSDTGRDTQKGNYTTSEPWLKVTSYYSLQRDGLSSIAGSLATSDGFTTMIEIQYILPANFTGDEKGRISALMDAIEDYSVNHASDFFSVHFTGIHYFQADLTKSTRADIARMDMLVLPIALILIGVVLPRANPCFVWIIPLVTMITTCSIWSIIMRQVVKVMQITQFTPTVMMSLTLGMGVDYTLFLLSRYCEDTSNRRKAILRMLTKGGRVVIVSGVTLIFTFLGLCFLPLQMLKSMGVGAAVAIASAISANLIVVPALLYTPVGNWIVRGNGETMTESSLTRPLIEASHNSVAVDEGLPSLWYRLAKQLLHPYKGIIILLVTCQFLLPVIWRARDLNSSISFDLLLPSDSPSLKTYKKLGSKLGPGRLHPYRILFDGRDANITMTSSGGFDVMNMVIEELRLIDGELAPEKDAFLESLSTVDEQVNYLSKIKELSTSRTELTPLAIYGEQFDSSRSQPAVFTGISILENDVIPHAVFTAAKICGQVKPHCPLELLRVIDEVDKMSTAKGREATFLTATLGVSPFSDQGIAWLKAARAAIEQLTHSNGLDGVLVHIQGVASVEEDAVNAVYRVFPTMMMVTTLAVFALTGIFFKSLLTPFRSILTIGLTLGFSFGLGVLVYQDGVFNFTNLRALTSIGNDFCWLVPPLAFSIILGLALDYDAFLMCSILEFRMEGFDHKASIAAGLHATGGIITAAGGIMALAFGSLMLSSSTMLYQWSFLLTTAVLLDTFVIRTVVVPVVTSLAGECFWWPRDLPQARFHMPGSQQPSDDDVRSLLRSLEETSEYEPIIRSPGIREEGPLDSP